MRPGSIVKLSVVVCLFNLGSAAVYALDPSPLENAYWRFEEGTSGTRVPSGDNTVPDSINANHMQRWTAPDGDPDRAAPMYTDDVAAPIIPQTNAANTRALRFFRNPGGGGDDIFSSSKNINYPIIENGFTLEATFKVTFVGGGADFFQGIVCKEGAVLQGLPRLALKVRGDDARLHIELFDGSETLRGVRSLDAIMPNQWYHAAVVNTGTTLSLYLDSGSGYQLQGSDNLAGGALVSGNSNWVIGRAQYYNNPADWTDGIIDEVRVTNRVLEPIEFLFAQGFAAGDFDRDGDVDQDDLILLMNCATGPAVPYDPENPPPGCTLTADENGLLPPDFDGDGDIDSTDFALFQVLLGT